MDYEQARMRLAEAALTFIMGNMQDGEYSTFMDYIMKEPSNRWLMGVYVSESIERYGISKGLEDLSSMMVKSFDSIDSYDEDFAKVQAFLGVYEEQNEIFDAIQELFDVYNRVKITVEDYKRKMNGSIYPVTQEEKSWREEAMKEIRIIVDGNLYADHWPSTVI